MQDFLQHIINGISLGSIYALMALGYTMVYGVLQLINFAHSDVYMIGAFSSYYGARWMQLQDVKGFQYLLLLIFVAMFVCSAVGLAVERFAYRPLRKAPKLNILITAIGVSMLLQNAGQVIFGADPKLFPQVIEDTVVANIGIVQLRSLDVTIIAVSLVMMCLLQYLVFHTKMGRAMRSVSTQPNVSTLLGVNVNRIITITFIIGSSLAGVASVLVGIKYPKIEPLMGTFIGMKAFVAAVLGGVGNIMGAVLGGFIMGLSEEMVVGYLSSTYRDALAFAILIIILIFKPSGLLGKNSVEKV